MRPAHDSGRVLARVSLGGIAALGHGGDRKVLAPRRAIASDPDIAGLPADLARRLNKSLWRVGKRLADGLEHLIGLQGV